MGRFFVFLGAVLAMTVVGAIICALTAAHIGGPWPAVAFLAVLAIIVPIGVKLLDWAVDAH